MAESDSVPRYHRGDRVVLNDDTGPNCFVCGWGEGPGFVIETLWIEDEKRYSLDPICWVCYNTSSGNTARYSLRMVSRQATYMEVARLMAEHTNLILKEIRSGR